MVMSRIMKHIYFLFLLLILFSNTYSQSEICSTPLRESLNKLDEIKINSKWFKAFHVGKDVVAIVEPYNFEEVISYLIIGKKKALLFDTGIGVDSISLIVKQLTNLPIIVINSHTHYDHIGGNFEFDNIFALRTNFTIKHSKEGWNHEAVKHEVTKEALCLEKLNGFDTANYSIKPFSISKYILDGDQIDLGARKLKIISVPGHTPDAIAILDKNNGYLWTGDTYYEGPIYLFAKETDLIKYQNSIEKLAKIAPTIYKVFPSHNNPISSPKNLIALKTAFIKVKKGEIKGIIEIDNTVQFKFQNFGFKINKALLDYTKAY